jgi:hypothetical protein
VIEPVPASADDRSDLRRIGVLAAALFVVAWAALAARPSEAIGHSCGATDRRFIQAASIDVTALGSLPAEYQSVQAPEELARDAFDAAERVEHAEPRDPSLHTAQRYLDAMFTEYAHAMTLRSKGKDATERMYRAQLLATSARDVLAQAQPELSKRGCNVGPLL